MSKIIRITEEYANECRKDLEELLKNAKLADGKISFTKSFSYKDDKRKATVYFTPEAWAKMVILIQEFDKEVAWHGVASRFEDADTDEYMISDILVYPQEVTGVTVNTDQEKYQMWLMQQDDEVFNNIRMQGHSHVNMSVSPSGVDLTHQEKILDQLDDDMFYIFMIWNKSFKHHTKIYDMRKNVLFETSDVDVKILDGGIGLNEFISDAKEMVKNRTYPYTANSTPSTATTPYNPLPSGASKTDDKKDTDKPKSEEKTEAKGKTRTKIGSGGQSTSYPPEYDLEDYYNEIYMGGY